MLTNEHLRIDQLIGNYRLKRLIARSNTSDIYLGEHELFHTQAAIKILRGNRSKEDVAKFLAQADLLIHLHHPNILHVFDVGMLDDAPFLIMNYAPNGTVRQRFPKGERMPLPTIVRYTQEAASALQYIHQLKLIHRDIKPHNMLLGSDDEIMLSDFGIAVVSQSLDAVNSSFQDFEGTVLYAAPEQLQGKPRRSSDQYSLAIVVYEWLSGGWPFTGTFDEVVQQHLFTPAPPFSARGIEIAPEIEQVVLKALSKEPEQRFATIEEFANALKQASTLQLPSSPIPPAAPPLPKKRQFLSPLPFSKDTL